MMNKQKDPVAENSNSIEEEESSSPEKASHNTGSDDKTNSDPMGQNVNENPPSSSRSMFKNIRDRVASVFSSKKNSNSNDARLVPSTSRQFRKRHRSCDEKILCGTKPRPLISAPKLIYSTVPEVFAELSKENGSVPYLCDEKAVTIVRSASRYHQVHREINYPHESSEDIENKNN